MWIAISVPYTPTNYDSFLKQSFVEGLWNNDVAELFLMDGKTGKYEVIIAALSMNYPVMIKYRNLISVHLEHGGMQVFRVTESEMQLQFPYYHLQWKYFKY